MDGFGRSIQLMLHWRMIMKAQGMACSQGKMYTLHVVVWRLDMKSLLNSSAEMLSSHQNRVAFPSTGEAS